MTTASKEYKLAEQRWENAFQMGDACASFFDMGMTIEDIMLIMKKNKDDVQRALQLAKSFPPGQRDKAVPITVYLQVCRYPDPQKMLSRAWDRKMYATQIAEDFAKYQGQCNKPVPARVERQTPIEVALGVDDEGMTTAKNLYAFLELHPAAFSRWIKKNIEENVFAEQNLDYFSLNMDVECQDLGVRGHFARDYKLTASFAKKLAMSSQTPKGELAREYFIRVEQNAKAFANGMLDCMAPQYGAMKPDEAAQLILETAGNFKEYLPKVTLEKMITTALELKGFKQLN